MTSTVIYSKFSGEGPPRRSMKILSDIKPVHGTKKVGDHCLKRKQKECTFIFINVFINVRLVLVSLRKMCFSKEHIKCEFTQQQVVTRHYYVGEGT